MDSGYSIKIEFRNDTFGDTPLLAAGLFIYFLDLFIQDTLAFIADRGYGVRIVSIFDIYNVRQLSLITNASFPIFDPIRFPTAVCAKNNYCYIGLFSQDLDPASTLWVLDVTLPSNPILNPNFDGLGEGIEFMDIDSTYLFICEYEFSFYIFDISIPDSLICLSNLNLGWSHYYGGFRLRDDYAYVSDLEGIKIVDVTEKSNLILVGDYYVTPYTYAVFADQNYIYLCSYSGYLHVLKFIDPTNIEAKNDAFPNKFELKQNYPNPFNPTTTIKYYLPKSSSVELNLYNVNGQKIQSLFSGSKSIGNHKYILDGSNLASGLYFIQLQASDFKAMRKTLLIK